MTSIVTLLLFVLVSGTGCTVWEAHHAAIDAAQTLPPAYETPRPRERWHEPYLPAETSVAYHQGP
jgi:hypothetical protein